MKNLNNWKELALERGIRIGQLERENRELRERNENLYRAWKRATGENHRLKKILDGESGMSPEVKERIFKNITGRELPK